MVKMFNLIGLATAAAAVVALTQDVAAGTRTAGCDWSHEVSAQISHPPQDQQTKEAGPI
ncbi:MULTISPECIES: hypothetical protein [Sulfitobacter]|jgi:hypothetical protein|uniref:Uncharacterized protein n=2 Tax=Sulfitobacter TaxID=60136 RepID=A0ABY0RLE0_9RHOB|nr:MULTISPECIES: hypothetical protein [Sulfitobacter]MBQ0800182.1 hypothetical protein [Sulfitobacter litoralis]SDO12053.1 hypothetical protein SAMN04488512_10148 [Sulfitobacter litoralis]|tara:strand:- start:871 stop:1047 length:177 start_codon:yes stop_codon:yes gene_type:complete